MKILKVIFVLLFLFILTGCDNSVTITFVNSTNDEVIEIIETKKGSTVQYPDSPDVEGHRFIGWDSELTGFEKDTTVTAKYEIFSYLVEFYHNDEIIDTQVVKYGDAAVAPSDPEAPVGKYFAGWDQDISCVKEDISVEPIFKDIEFSVKFYDNDGNVISEQMVIYGKKAEAPEAPVVADHKFIGWDKTFNKVLEDLEIKPIYEILTYEVKFIDLYGNVLKTEILRPGMDATAPTVDNVDYHTFTGWDNEYTNVNSDLVVKAVYQENKKSLNMDNVEYWLQILSDKYNISDELLTKEEIDAYNQKILGGYASTKVVDVTNLGEKILGSKVKTLINGYSNIYKYTVYANDTKLALSTSDLNPILSQRNLDNIPENVTIKYGIITDFAWMRSYPTNAYASSYSRDMFQETGLNVGEGVAIYHTSTDGNWCFVQAENYCGWVEKKNIALCSYDEMVSLLQPVEKIVVLEKYIYIEDACVRMGQYFPYVSENDTDYTIKFPTRDNSGNLVIKDITLSKTYDLSKGFLKYNYKNVYKLAYELLGVNYSWGDKESDGWDCSSTQNAIYSCFGFMMPRNTSNQKSIPSYGLSQYGVNDTTMKQKYVPGTLIFSSGHVMMYIGEDANGVSYLFHNTSAGEAKCILQPLRDYGGSKIIGVLKMK